MQNWDIRTVQILETEYEVRYHSFSLLHAQHHVDINEPLRHWEPHETSSCTQYGDHGTY